MLVLEDEPIVALDIEGALIDAGFDVPATLATSAKALAWLVANTPDVVVLDIRLADGSSIHIARHLLGKAIPFVVFSGTSPAEPDVDPVFRTGHWLEKPAVSHRIIGAVHQVLTVIV